MATEWVLDASVAVKLFIEEPGSAEADDFLSKLPKSARLLAPSLLRYEVGNACVRRSAFTGLESFLGRLMDDVAAHEPRDVARFCDQLSYYDASYLALAVEQKAGLLTADDRLRKAARKHGVEVGP